jgi:hypothetical protein
VLLAVGWHSLLDAVAVYASQTWNPYITEVIILAFGLISLGLILYMRPSSQPVQDDIHTAYPDSSELALPEIQPIVASKDDLEDSRYD